MIDLSERVKGRRIDEKGRQAMFGGKGISARSARLKNRRIILANDGNRYLVHFRHLTEEKKIHDLKFVLTPEAMFALVSLFIDSQGPLPANIRWDAFGGIEEVRS